MEFDSVRFKKFLQTYGKSEVIFEEGSFGFEMYVVRSGGVRIYRASAQGEIEVAIVKQGEFFGEMLWSITPLAARVLAPWRTTPGLLRWTRTNFSFSSASSQHLPWWLCTCFAKKSAPSASPFFRQANLTQCYRNAR